VEALHVDVELEALEAVAVERFPGHVEHVRIARVHGAERQAGGQASCRLVEPRVQITGQARLVSVGEEDEPLHRPLGEEAGHQLRIGRVAELPPGPALEPPADRLPEPRRVQVRVDVDVAEAGRRHGHQP
jgi:hypothetical protein